MEPEEHEKSEEFIREGFLKAKVASIDAFKWMQEKIFEYSVSQLGVKLPLEINCTDFFNNAHLYISSEELNNFRVEIIRKINQEPHFRKIYYEVAKPYLELLVGNELAMQARINLSIQLPGDVESLLPVHADVWSGDSPYEVVVWLPLVDCYQTKAMYLLSPSKNQDLEKNFYKASSGSSENLFKKIEDDVLWIEINAGELLVFNQNLPHGNRVNEESETRWSLNCRFKSIFTPYGDKKIGEFFEPITLRAASRIGMNYKFPSLKKLDGGIL